ncbi:MAG: hypothetical protein M3N46_04725 [Actinomycetota bacterium]|nr:hypothetical protein [Actinomycetota bacterium]
MLEPDPVRAAARERRRRDRIGNTACQLCGEADPDVLDRLDGHHVANRINDHAMTVVLCSNCHRRQTAALKAAGVPNRYSDGPNGLDRVSAILAGVGIFLAYLAATFAECARWLDEHQRRLVAAGLDMDELLPTWNLRANARA